MGKHRGGRKRTYKKKGREPAKKGYQGTVKSQLRSGMTNDAEGKWHDRDSHESLRSRGLLGKV